MAAAFGIAKRISDLLPSGRGCSLLWKHRQLVAAQVRWFGQPVAQTHPHLIREGQVTPGITAEEYRQRRDRLMQKIVEKCDTLNKEIRNVVIIPSAPKVFMTHDIPYTFRQNTDFLYLCGFLEPDSVLLLESSGEVNSRYKSVLFVPKRDSEREMWDGPRSGRDGALSLTGVDEAYNVEDFENYLRQSLKVSQRLREGQASAVTWYDFRKPTHIEYHQKYVAKILTEARCGPVQSPRAIVQHLRLHKSTAEVELMRKTCTIASKGFAEVMKFSKAGTNEAHLFARMEYECKMLGADYLAYPPVVAGGNRAVTIHYVSNNQLIRDGEMVLMDAGCEYHGYTSDITRTWPINGRFLPHQRDLYEALLEIQQQCIGLCQPDGLSLNEIFFEMLRLLSRQLQRLRLIPERLTEQQAIMYARSICPHHSSHYLGMDVHDTDEMSRQIPLQPGMVITVEPGIYLREDHPGLRKEFRGLGIRIEDDVLIRSDGPEVLTASCPKTVGEIERLMNCGESEKSL